MTGINCQRPGFSPDYVDQPYERMDVAYERTDWVPTADGPGPVAQQRASARLYRRPGLPLQSKEHNFRPGETVEKQIIIINNSRATVAADCTWSLGLSEPVSGHKSVTIATGQQEHVPVRFALPGAVAAGAYDLECDGHVQHG